MANAFAVVKTIPEQPMACIVYFIFYLVWQEGKK